MSWIIAAGNSLKSLASFRVEYTYVNDKCVILYKVVTIYREKYAAFPCTLEAKWFLITLS